MSSSLLRCTQVFQQAWSVSGICKCRRIPLPRATCVFNTAATSGHGRRLAVELAAATGDEPSTSNQKANSNVSGESRQRLAKVLAGSGVASRRACESLIAQGHVRVNGRVVQEQGTTVEPLRDRVEIWKPKAATAGDASASVGQQGSNGAATSGTAAGAVRSGAASGEGAWRAVPVRAFRDEDSRVYFAVNKPKGYICSSADVSGKGKLAVELLEPWMRKWQRTNKDQKRLPPRLFTVGRLDVASSGLIFITNDGQWANRVIHPSSGVTKEYQVTLDQDATRPQLEALAAGTEVAGSLVVPLEVEVLGEPRRVRIVVQEGKKHEVRELVKAAGMELVALKRVRIGGYRLPRDLGLGGYKELKPADLRLVTDPRAQESANASGETRQEQQRAAAAAKRVATARSSLPHALRGMSDGALDAWRRAQE